MHSPVWPVSVKGRAARVKVGSFEVVHLRDARAGQIA